MKFTLYAVLFLGLSALISFSHVHASKTGIGAHQMENEVDIADAIEHVSRRSSTPKPISVKGKSQSTMLKLFISTVILATLALIGSKFIIPQKQPPTIKAPPYPTEVSAGPAKEIGKLGRSFKVPSYLQNLYARTADKIRNLGRSIKDPSLKKLYAGTAEKIEEIEKSPYPEKVSEGPAEEIRTIEMSPYLQELYARNAAEIGRLGRCNFFYIQESAGVQILKHVKLAKGEVTDPGFREAYIKAETNAESALNKSIDAGTPTNSMYFDDIGDFSFSFVVKVVPDSSAASESESASPFKAFMATLDEHIRKGNTKVVQLVERHDGVKVKVEATVEKLKGYDQVPPTNNPEEQISPEINHAVFMINRSRILDVLESQLSSMANETSTRKCTGLFQSSVKCTMTTAEGSDEVNLDTGDSHPDGETGESKSKKPSPSESSSPSETSPSPKSSSPLEKPSHSETS